MRDQVKDGMTTHRAAKEAGGLFVQELRQALADASSFTTRPELKAKLLTAKNARVDAKARVTTDDLLREMVKGQERLRTEQEIANRQASFRSVDRRMGPSGVVMIEDLPTALYQHRAAKEANDQAALTFWSRRLEGLRHMALDAAQHDAIDTAVTTRDMVNPRIVARFVDALGRATPEEVDRFAREALAEGHSSGIAA